jgi:hypothetical protein
MNTLDSYVEVTGQARLVESTVEYRAELDLAVRAVQSVTALAEAGELRDQCISALRSAGLKGDGLTEGGAAVWQPWWRKQKPGREVSRKILISCTGRWRRSSRCSPTRGTP